MAEKDPQRSHEVRDELRSRSRELDELGIDDPVISLVKMSPTEVKRYTDRINDFLQSPGLVAIRICECCINVDIN